ncbi:NlpC/P60 family protein [Caulobacter hibisci]|uniref:C40 family peptidase n=1 Tax=Caulobacter hibisci TaxID=2035993 RepID=A0ABS0T1S8_9CAUL|nr:NlpC/P60 family protein [Caulobacter hibisci]MBI1685827.1 C40 family peptidase [Caulobacter hibisci]
MSARGAMSDRVLAEARGWLGTPYQHQASLKGVGCDCLGLVRGVWRGLGGAEIAPPPYRPDWAELGGGEPLLDGLAGVLSAVDPWAARPGDVLAFRMARGVPAKHCAILSGEGARMIHAYWGRACVESWLGPWWRTRLVAAFSFPEQV